MARLRCCRYGRSALPDQLTRDGINTELLPLRRSILREHFDFGVDEMRVPQHLLPGLAGAGVAVVGFECQRFRGAGTKTFRSRRRKERAAPFLRGVGLTKQRVQL